MDKASLNAMRAALKEIATNPCLDPEGNAEIAKRALAVVATEHSGTAACNDAVSEREACAKIADGMKSTETDWDTSCWNQCADRIAMHIRMRKIVCGDDF